MRHGRTAPARHKIKLSNYMETPTHTAPPVASTDLFASLVRRHNLSVNDLTETQLAEAIRQAMPDFRRYVHANKQAVVYLPGQEADRWKDRCAELRQYAAHALGLLNKLEYEREEDGKGELVATLDLDWFFHVKRRLEKILISPPNDQTHPPA